MKKEFVPYEIALALKELGFRESCFAYYNNHLPKNNRQRGLILSQYSVQDHNDETEGDNLICSAPLYQQAFRWFREKYGLHPSFTRYKSSSINREPTIFTHLYEIQIIDENADKIFHVGDFNSLEEAELECLKKLIEIVKDGRS